MTGKKVSLRRALQMGTRLAVNIAAYHAGRPRPLAALFEITYRCNRKCVFCNEKNFETEELDTKSAVDIIDQLDRLGASVVVFTGGEPTLRDDLFEILEQVGKGRMASVLCTNGSRIKESLAALLRCDMIRIGVHGFREFHDRITGVPGAFRVVEEGVSRLVGEGKIPTLVTVITADTPFENLYRLLEAARHWGVYVELSMVTLSRRTKPTLETDSEEVGEQVRARQNEEVFLKWTAELECAFPDVVVMPRFYRLLVEKRGLGKSCRAMQVGIAVRPDGRVSVPCDGFSIERLEGRLTDIWAKMQNMDAIQKRLGTYDFCARCYKRCSAVPSLVPNPFHLYDLFRSGRSFPIVSRAFKL